MATASDADATMQQALDQFRARMGAASRQFIQDRVAEIEARGIATEQEKILRMADRCNLEALDTDDQRLAEIPAPVESASPLLSMDGVYPTRLYTDEARQIYLDTLQEVFQRQAEEWAAAEGEDPPGPIPRCDELGRFLRYAQGVIDPDFRRSGVAPFEVGLYVMSKPEDMVLAEDLESSEQRERYHERISMIAGPDCDMEVRAGLGMGEAYVGHYPKLYSAYLYCRQRPDDGEDEDVLDEDEDVPDAPNIQEWGWRVVFMEFGGDAYCGQVLYGRKPRFDSIPEFLDWYASWPDYLDARGILSLRRRAIHCEIDCESD
ncbi:hypothetical protein BO71DRAFT_414974 [Aspergillus ellipticus CBS 707.79]|uniref:Uncharacterized protein n=1 Tax=Aspergillus ellipticus CBS 707.79 TaxID=1448320 RepID=A0A319EGY4_9EURO|nr:hypothetical protein BO71DRAFT_414974 [Aspergillus ellipticus CBS 707.79]